MPLCLQDLQRAMADSILDSNIDFPLDLIVTPEGVDPSLRCEVYTQGYPARIQESLSETFPAIANILGSQGMQALTQRYLAQPRELPRNLNYVGDQLARHLENDPLADDLPFLPDLANFEWAVAECFHATNVPPFDLSRCAEWGMERWGNARIVFQPGSRVVQSPWPLVALRDTRKDEREAIDLSLDAAEDAILVYRSDLEVRIDAIDDSEAQAFLQLRAGKRLGAVIESFVYSGEAAEYVTQLFAGWISRGLVLQCE